MADFSVSPARLAELQRQQIEIASAQACRADQAQLAHDAMVSDYIDLGRRQAEQSLSLQQLDRMSSIARMQGKVLIPTAMAIASVPGSDEIDGLARRHGPLCFDGAMAYIKAVAVVHQIIKRSIANDSIA